MFKLLCVDDEVKILKILKRVFQAEQFEIFTASSGEAAIQILKTTNMDAIITDFRMSGMNGVEFLKIAKEIQPSAVRIMLTAYSNLDITISAINEGAINKYIVKPWDNDELFKIIETIRLQKESMKRMDKMSGDFLKKEAEREIRDIREALRQSNFSTVRALSCAIELKDKYTKGHCDRVLKLSEMLASAVGLSKERFVHLRYAALLHDIGKIGIGLDILNKEGPLTPDEMSIIKQHPQKGAFITSEIEFLSDATDIIIEHHEKIDGTGYPAGKKGAELLIESKMLSIADVFDACTSNRSYRKAMPFPMVQKILIDGRDKAFDGKLVDIFINELEKQDNAVLKTPVSI